MSANCVIVDRTHASKGIITSRRAAEMLEFIESCGGAPEGALSITFRKSLQLIGKLRGAGMIYRAKADKETLWLPVDVPAPVYEQFLKISAVGWLAARLKESGGAYKDGNAIFPTGRVFPVSIVPPSPRGVCLAVIIKPGKTSLEKGSVWVAKQDLVVRNIKECLKAI